MSRTRACYFAGSAVRTDRVACRSHVAKTACETLRSANPTRSGGDRLNRRRGYVLVVSLGLLVLATTLLVAVGHMATQRAIDARLAGEELQRRWGAVSCRQAIVPFAETILAAAEGRGVVPVPRLDAVVLLGNQTFRLIVADEQAKANVNALIDTSDKSSAENRMRQSFSGSGLGNALRLRIDPHAADVADSGPQTQPSATQPASNGLPHWVSGFGQIFNDVAPGRLIEGRGGSPADRVTCWGDGGINVMRASDASLQLSAGESLTRLEVGRLVDARNAALAPPDPMARFFHAATGATSNNRNLDPVSQLLADAQIKPKNRATLGLTTKSTCHSLWIVIEDGRRSWYQFFVSDETNPAGPQIESFVW